MTLSTIGDPRPYRFEMGRLVKVDGKYVYLEKTAAPPDVLSCFQSDRPPDVYHAALALRDIAASLDRWMTMLGRRLDVPSMLRRIVEHPLEPSAPVAGRAAYELTQRKVAITLLQGVLDDAG